MADLDFSRLDNVAWSFQEGTYGTRDEFIAALNTYNEELKDALPDLSHDYPVEDFELIPGDALRVRFMGVDPENSEEYSDMEVVIESGDGSPLRFYDFMYMLNEHLYPVLQDADHFFFEGLAELESNDAIPTVEVIQGS
jgi:hypothetical protein